MSKYKITLQNDLDAVGIKHPETFCAFPFFQVAIKDWVDGSPARIAPCCNALGIAQNPLNLDLNDVKNKTIKEIFDGPEFSNLRESLLAGVKHKMCSYCWKLESEGSYSPRLPALDFLADCVDQDRTLVDSLSELVKEAKILSMDVNFDNDCNLKCRMCSPNNSRKLTIDRTAMEEAGYQPPMGLASYQAADYVDGMEISEISLKSLDGLKEISHSLTGIKIAGGEPTISKHFWSWMDYIEEHDLKKNMSVHLTTNGTKFNKKFINAISGFKNIELIVSIDAVGKVYDYIRHPFNWEKIKKNVETLYAANLPNVRIDIVYISTNIGLSSIPAMVEWVATMPNIHLDVNLFVRPEDGPLSPRWVPHTILQKYITDIEAAIEGKEFNAAFKTRESLDNLKYYLTTPEDPQKQKLLKRFLVLFDKVRNQNYRDYLDPDMVEFLDKIELTEEYLRNAGEYKYKFR